MPYLPQGRGEKKAKQPGRRDTTILRQLVELIPPYLVPKLAREAGVTDQARTFTPWSHVATMLYAQVSHAFGLNDVCDALRLQVTALGAMRGATPPARNTLSHANQARDCALAEKLFWQMLEHLQSGHPGFGRGGKKALAWRFRRAISIVDATTIRLVANCLDWARHRRRKAAAKCHLRLDLQSFLPRFAIVDTAGEHDSVRAPELCAGLHEGEIVIFDKAYVHFAHLWTLATRGIFWVTRSKANLVVQVKKRLPRHADPRILRDDLVVLRGVKTARDYPHVLRRVTARIEIDGQERVMVFLTNHLDWSPVTVCDLYRCRWTIEVFFKQLKQIVQPVDFLGNSANRSGPRRSCICSCVSSPDARAGRTASRDCSPMGAPRSGCGAPSPNCCAAVEQHRGAAAQPLRPARANCPVSGRCPWDSTRELSAVNPENHQSHRFPPPPCLRSLASSCVITPTPCETGLKGHHVVSSEGDSPFARMNTRPSEGKKKAASKLMLKLIPDVQDWIKKAQL